jgi:hypothetical protein
MNKPNQILKLNKPVSIKNLLEQRYSIRVEGEGENPFGMGPSAWGRSYRQSRDPYGVIHDIRDPRWRGVPSGSGGEWWDDEERDDEDRGMVKMSSKNQSGSRNVALDTIAVSGVIGAGKAAADAAAPVLDPAWQGIKTGSSKGLASGMGKVTQAGQRGIPAAKTLIKSTAKGAWKGGVEGVNAWRSGAGAVGQGAGAIGQGAGAIGQGAGAIGQGAGAVGQGAGAVGQGAGAIGQGAGAVGQGAGAVGQGAGAVGQGAGAVGQGAGAVGQGAGAVGQGAGAVGKVASASGKLGKVASASGKAVGKVALSAGKAVGKGVLKVLPGVGAAISGIEAYDQFKKGNYGQALGRAALGVIGLGSLIPGLGLIPGAISLGGNLAMDMFTEQPTTYYRNLLIEEIVNIKNKGTMTKGEISDRDRLAKRVKAKAIKGKDTEQNAQYRLATHITLKNRKEGSSKKTKRSSKGNNKSKK